MLDAFRQRPLVVIWQNGYGFLINDCPCIDIGLSEIYKKIYLILLKIDLSVLLRRSERYNRIDERLLPMLVAARGRL